jgi:hypothetical protein
MKKDLQKVSYQYYKVLCTYIHYSFTKLLWFSITISVILLLSGCLKEKNSLQLQSFVKFYENSSSAAGADVKETDDGGFVMVGTAATVNRGTDIVMIKTDMYGNQEWLPKFYGGNLNDSGFSVQLTKDGGYIIAGSKEIDTGGVIVSKIFVIKTNAQGDSVWTRVIGGAKNDVAYFIQINGNNGYLVAGYTDSYGSGGKDAILVNLDVNGNINWLRTYGSKSNEVIKCVQLTKDGFILIGNTDFTLQKTTNIFVVKTNSIGLLLQIAVIGGNDNYSGECIQVLPDGGFIGIGTKTAADNSYSNIRLFKLGNDIDSVLWTKDYGMNTERNEGKSIQITSDNAFAIIGTKSVSSTNSNIYFIKTNTNGNVIYSRNYGPYGIQNVSNIEQTIDGGFVIIGTNHIEGYNALTLIKVTSDGILK